MIHPEADIVDIVFDGPPGNESGRFVEVEDSKGCSINFGEWLQRDDGYWVLRVPRATSPSRGEDLSSAAGAAPFDPYGLAFRLRVRLDAILERDRSEEAAITGRGIGISYLFAKQLYAALLSGGWRPITEADVGKTMLVTNNIRARDTFGEMSNRWITWIQASDRPEVTGKYIGYTDGDRLLHGLTHCAPLPDPKQEGLAEGLREPQASHPQSSRGEDKVREAPADIIKLIEPLTSHNEDYIWRPATKAVGKLRELGRALVSTVTPVRDEPPPLDNDTLRAGYAAADRALLKSVEIVTPAEDRVREALKAVREEVVVAIAFLGRDAGSDRLANTASQLVDRLVKADKIAIRALASTVTPAGDGVREATNRVRDEVGSALCYWAADGTVRTCWKDVGKVSCLCEDAAKAAIAVAKQSQAPSLHGPFGYLVCSLGAGHEDEWRIEDDADPNVLSLPLYTLQSPPGLTAPAAPLPSGGGEDGLRDKYRTALQAICDLDDEQGQGWFKIAHQQLQIALDALTPTEEQDGEKGK